MDYCDILNEVDIWKYLPIANISKLCQSTPKFKHFGNNNYIWKYLLQRDFRKQPVEENAKELYCQYYCILNFFGPHFSIITQSTIELINRFLPQVYWEALIKSIDYLNHTSVILGTTLVEIIMNEMESLCRQNDLIKAELEYEEVTQIRKINQLTHIEIPYQQVCTSNKHFTEEEAERIGTEVGSDGVNILIEYGRTPTIIYIRKEPKVVEFNLDIIDEIMPYIPYFRCDKFVDDFKIHLFNE